jgi:branched-chain amino acid transport system substrate-binding protein
MSTRRIILAAAGALAVALPAAAQPRIQVGHLMDNSGPTSDVGLPYGEGVRDALAWVNASRNGVAGRQLNVSGFDYGYQAPRAISQYQAWSRIPVVAIQGWGTVDTEALIRFVTRDRIPYISGSYSAALTDPTGRSGRQGVEAAPFNFFYGPSYSDALRGMLQWAAQDWRARGGQGRPRYVHMGANHPYPNSPKAAGEALAAELGFEVLPAIQFALTPGDYTAQCLTLRQQGAHYAYLGNTAGSNISVLRACQTAGVQVQFLGNVWGMDENAMKAAGTAANGVVFPVRTAASWGEIVGQVAPPAPSRSPGVTGALAALRAAQEALRPVEGAQAVLTAVAEAITVLEAEPPVAPAGPPPGFARLREISRISDASGNAYRPVHYLAGVCSAMLMVEAMETAAANNGQVSGERIRDGFYARQNWVPAGFEGVCNPSTFTPQDHRGTLRVALYRSVVTGNTAQGSVDELMRNGTMRIEPVTVVELPRRDDWLGW